MTRERAGRVRGRKSQSLGIEIAGGSKGRQKQTGPESLSGPVAVCARFISLPVFTSGRFHGVQERLDFLAQGFGLFGQVPRCGKHLFGRRTG